MRMFVECCYIYFYTRHTESSPHLTVHTSQPFRSRREQAIINQLCGFKTWRRTNCQYVIIPCMSSSRYSRRPSYHMQLSAHPHCGPSTSAPGRCCRGYIARRPLPLFQVTKPIARSSQTPRLLAATGNLPATTVFVICPGSRSRASSAFLKARVPVMLGRVAVWLPSGRLRGGLRNS